MKKRSILHRSVVVAVIVGAAVQACSLAAYDLASHCSISETLGMLVIPLLPFVILGLPAVWLVKTGDSGSQLVLLVAGLILTVFTVWFHFALWRDYPPPDHLQYQDFAPLILFGLECGFSLVLVATSVGVGLVARARSKGGRPDVAS